LQHKAPGSTLLSGSRNGGNAMIARVIKEQDQSTLATMIRDISETTESKISSQKLADSIIPWFALGVMALAVTRSVIAFVLLDRVIPLSARINIVGKSMMTILTAACPCAIGLSVPSAIMSAVGTYHVFYKVAHTLTNVVVDAAWRSGILIVGGGSVLERLSEVTCIVMDKTGTLTQGTHSVRGHDLSLAWTTPPAFSKFCLLICATEEPGTAVHPIGRAIFEHYFKKVPLARHFRDHCTITSRIEIPGQGMDCSITMRDHSTYHILIGNEALLLSQHPIVPIPNSYPIDDSTVAVHIAINNEYVGRIFLHDTIRNDVPATLSLLRKRLSPRNSQFHNQPLHLTILTGDSESEALRVSQKLSLPILASKASPSTKLSLINQLQAQGHKVAMVGDGINDALSLSAAHVGIMMTTDSQQCSTIGGHILVLSPHFSALSDLFEITDKTMRQIRWNLVWAASYNVVALALAMGLGEGLGISISPPIAAGLMSLSSIGVVAHSLAMRKGLVEGKGMGKSGSTSDVEKVIDT
jgi:Cu+-exporting ATPase